MILLRCLQWCLIEITKEWIRVMNDESEYIKNMEQFESYKKLHSMETQYWYDLAVTNDVWLNLQNIVW